MTQIRDCCSQSIVLIVSDQPSAASALEDLVGNADCAVVQSLPDDLSLQFVHELQPDAVVVGWAPAAQNDSASMNDALEVTHRVRLATNAATPIVIASTMVASGAERMAAHGAGAWDIVHLPLDADLFIARIHSFVRAKREFDRFRAASLHGGCQDLDTGRAIASHS